MELLNTLGALLDGLVAPALGVIIIPRFLRARGTGEFIGFRDIKLLYIFLGWAIVCTLRLMPEYGFTAEAALRTMVAIVIPFVGGYVLVKITDWAGWDTSMQTRR